MTSDKEIYDSITSRMNGFLYRCNNDSDYTMIVMSGRVDEVTGYLKSEFINNRSYSYVNIIHKDDVEKVDKAVSFGIDNKKNWDVDYRIVKKDGSIQWLNEHGGPVFNDNKELLYLEGFNQLTLFL